MKRVVYLSGFLSLLLISLSASAQSEALPVNALTGQPEALSPIPISASASITTRLSTIILDEPVSEEGFATIRIADEAGEVVYRGMKPMNAGARSLDLSAVRIPAAGRYMVRVIYPGGSLVQEVETAYTTASAAAASKATAVR